MNRNSLKGRGGFTLVEVVITTLLIMVVMVPIIRLSYLVVRNTQYARDAGEALALGQARLEEMAEADYDTLADGTEAVGDYNLAWTVTESANRKIVNFSIQWAIMETNQEIELNTVFSDELDSSYTLP